MRKSSTIIATMTVALLTLMVTSNDSLGQTEQKSTIQVGSSCEGIGAMDAKMVCVDNKILFCSSFTGYKYKIQTECQKDQTCQMAPSGKSASCKPK